MSNSDSVSDFTVISYDNLTNYEINKEAVVRNVNTKHIIKVSLMNDFSVVSLKPSGSSSYKKYRLHYLLASTFIDNPNDFNYVVFIDGNHNNLSIDNLEWSPTQLHTNVDRKQKVVEDDLMNYRQVGFINNIDFFNYRINMNGDVLNHNNSKLSPTIDSSGHKLIRLSNNGKTVVVSLDRLIGKVFLNNGNYFFNDKNYIVVRNSDNKLEWVNQSDYFKSKFGVKVCQLDNDGNVINSFDSISDACRSLGVNPSRGSDIKRCIDGKRKSAIGFKWKLS